MIKIVTNEDLHEMSAWVTPNTQDAPCSDCYDVKRAINAGDMKQFQRLLNCSPDEVPDAVKTCRRCLWFWVDEVEEAEEERSLPLEELRGMDGEPVWVEFPKCPEANGWMLIDVRRHCVYGGLLGDCGFENCGKTWLAYHHKPEGRIADET